MPKSKKLVYTLSTHVHLQMCKTITINSHFRVSLVPLTLCTLQSLMMNVVLVRYGLVPCTIRTIHARLIAWVDEDGNPPPQHD